MDLAELRPHLLDGGQLRRLHGEGDTDPALFPGGCALLQASVGALAAAPHHRRQRLYLLGRWQQVVREGLAPCAHTPLLHSHLFCLRGGTSAAIGTVVALMSARATRLASPCLQE